MFIEAYLEPSRTSTMELFFTSVKLYFKNVLNSIELPYGSIFYTTHIFGKNLQPWKLREKSLLLTIEQFFFETWNYTMEWRHQWRRFFKLASVKSVKTAALFSFYYFKYYDQNIYRKWNIKSFVLDGYF